jgi:hypothetical protein
MDRIVVAEDPMQKLSAAETEWRAWLSGVDSAQLLASRDNEYEADKSHLEPYLDRWGTVRSTAC